MKEFAKTLLKEMLLQPGIFKICMIRRGS